MITRKGGAPLSRRYGKWIALFLAPALLLYALIYLYPLISVFVLGFTKWDGFTTPVFLGLDNYRKLFANPAFQQAMKNTLLWAVCAMVIHVPFGVLVALILNKKMRGWRFTRAAFMVPNVIAPSAMALMFVFVYKPDEGILNSLLRLIGIDAHQNWLFSQSTAFGALTMIWLLFAAVITLITLSELMAIPDEIYESARIDGANTWQIDGHICLPLLRKIIGTGMVIAITAVFRKFDIVYLTTNGGPGNATMTLSVMMVNAITNTMSYGYANAIGSILIVMGIFVMQICSRLFRMGASSYE
jgi:raffinose/stachyose/melibiose transport system permease protein